MACTKVQTVSRIDKLKEQLAQKMSALGSFHPEVIRVIAELSDELLAQNELARAERVCLRGLELLLNSKNRPEQVAGMLAIYGRALKQMCRRHEAQAVLQSVWALRYRASCVETSGSAGCN